MPCTNGHLFIHDGEKPQEIEGSKLNLKILFEKFRGTKSNSLLSAPFFCAVAKFLGAEDKVLKNFLTKLYRNLSLRAFSARDNSQFLDFSTMRDVIAETNIHLANANGENFKRQREKKGKKLENLKQVKKLKKKQKKKQKLMIRTFWTLNLK